MKINHHKANILILLILILTASSLMGLLAWFLLTNFIVYNDQIYQHQQATCITKAGLELGLTMVENREVGFEYHLNNDNNPLIDNFIYCNQDCDFTLDVYANAPALVKNYRELGIDCNNQSANRIILDPGLSLIIPLFKDKGSSSIYQSLTETKMISTHPLDAKLIFLDGTPLQRRFIIHYDDHQFTDQELQAQITNPLIGEGIRNKYSYYIINNSSEKVQELCIESNSLSKLIPQTNIFIQSIGSFRNTSLGKKAIFEKDIPNFLKGDVYWLQ